jgi:UDPglucose 6-dehydrogenase
MKIKNLGIVGQGFVGSAVREGMKNYYDVYTYDKFKKQDSTEKDLVTLSIKSDVGFICLPTPMRDDGSCYLGILEEVLTDLNNIATLGEQYCNIFVVKSTIPPGSTENWNTTYKNIDIVFNPEFLTEANAMDDYKNQNRIVIGGPRKATTIVKQVFSKAFPTVPIIKTSSSMAELVKYTTNCFLATKVSFANEMYEICEALDLDYDKLIEYATNDARLGYSHWSVPGPDGDFGFGGHCFPKDLSALIYQAKSLGVDPSMLKAVEDKNNKVREDRDWEGQEGRAVISNVSLDKEA